MQNESFEEEDKKEIKSLATLIEGAKLVMVILEDGKKAALGTDLQEIIVDALTVYANIGENYESKLSS